MVRVSGKQQRQPRKGSGAALLLKALDIGEAENNPTRANVKGWNASSGSPAAKRHPGDVPAGGELFGSQGNRGKGWLFLPGFRAGLGVGFV